MTEEFSTAQLELIDAIVQQRLAEQRESMTSPPASVEPHRRGSGGGEHSRRWLLTAGAGAAVAGVGAVLVTSEPAAAAAGGNMVLGGNSTANDAGSTETDLTSTSASYTLNVHNTNTSTTSGVGTAIGAYTTSNAAALSAVNGNTTGGSGVSGSSTAGAGVSGSSANSYGVYGTTSGQSSGVYGANTSSSTTLNGPGIDGTSAMSYGVRGQTSNNSPAVYGNNTGTSAGVQGDSAVNYGVIGTGGGGGAGVYGQNTSTSFSMSGPGVVGISANSYGVFGQVANGTAAVSGLNTASGYGIEADSANGYGIFANSNGSYGIAASGGPGQPDLVALGTADSLSGRILSNLFPAAGAPASGRFTQGEQIRDANGQMWLCVATGTPGTWQKVAAVAPGANGGSTNMLATPFRLYDSRSGATDGAIAPKGPIQSGASNAVTLQVTGTAPVGGSAAQGVPAGAIGIVGTITVTNTQGAGYLVAYPAGGTVPGTSNVNMTASGQTVASAYTAALSSAGAVTVQCGGGPTDWILDITGYIY